MLETIDNIFKSIVSYEQYWCKTMGFLNPYIDGNTPGTTKGN